MTGKKIIAVCSLCGHEYATWWDEAAMNEHMASVHGMYFDPGNGRLSQPRWQSGDTVEQRPAAG